MSPRARQRAWTEPKQNASHHRGGHLEANSLEALTLLKRVSCSALLGSALGLLGNDELAQRLIDGLSGSELGCDIRFEDDGDRSLREALGVLVPLALRAVILG